MHDDAMSDTSVRRGADPDNVDLSVFISTNGAAHFGRADVESGDDASLRFGVLCHLNPQQDVKNLSRLRNFHAP